MTEYFIVANSFAAPFVSETSTKYVEADNPEAALTDFAAGYKDSRFGLYAAMCYANADAYHKGARPLAKWLCNHEIEKERLTKDIGSFTYLSVGVGEFEINGTRHVVANPKDGRIVPLK